MLRVAIGWHFCYAGIVKFMQGDWTSAGYLHASTGPFAPFFRSLAEDGGLISITSQWSVELITVIDQLNIWGQIFVGLGLMLGLFTRVSILGCITMLALYYFSNPPWPVATPAESSTAMLNQLRYSGGFFWQGIQLPGYEISYIYVNKNLIEIFALVTLLTFNTGKIVGLDAAIYRWRVKRRKEKSPPPAPKEIPTQLENEPREPSVESKTK